MEQSNTLESSGIKKNYIAKEALCFSEGWSCQNVLESLPYHIVFGLQSVRFAVVWFLLGFQGTAEMLSRWPIGRIACGCLSGGELLSKTPTSRSNGKVSHKHPLRGPFSLDTCAKTSSRIYFLNLISKRNPCNMTSFWLAIWSHYFIRSTYRTCLLTEQKQGHVL